MAFYNEVIIGRKFNNQISFQLAPTFVHRNLVSQATESNDVYALGIGGRIKMSKRIAFVVDYHYIMSGLDKGIYKDPLSIGFDIETGGHVFQLHFSNATGMNEKSFITKTTNSWGKGEIRFGFNLSRVFTSTGTTTATVMTELNGFFGGGASYGDAGFTASTIFNVEYRYASNVLTVRGIATHPICNVVAATGNTSTIANGNILTLEMVNAL
jgi:hypothetical protein